MKRHELYRYPRLPSFAPWNALYGDAGTVVAMRLALMPWLWLSDPRAAERELRTMVDEKSDAWQETALALLEAPWRFWFDVASGGPLALSRRHLDGAGDRASARLARPAHRRVRANRKRLGGKGRKAGH